MFQQTPDIRIKGSKLLPIFGISRNFITNQLSGYVDVWEICAKEVRLVNRFQEICLLLILKDGLRLALRAAVRSSAVVCKDVEGASEER
jgi:hypothetical protein